MARRNLWIASASLACLLAAVVAVGAQTTPVADVDVGRALTGAWELTVPRATAQATVDEAISRVTGSIPIVGGALANELRERNVISRRFTLDIQPDEIHSHFETAEFRTRPGVSERLPVPGSPQETMEVVQIVREGHLEQIFTTGRGRRWSTFTPSSDGNGLTLDVVVASRLLPDEMRYRLQYRRTE